MMSLEFERNIKHKPPSEGVVVEVCGTDAYGEWIKKAVRKDYKQGCSKQQKKRKWRWMDLSGEKLDEIVEGWRPAPDAH